MNVVSISGYQIPTTAGLGYGECVTDDSSVYLLLSKRAEVPDNDDWLTAAEKEWYERKRTAKRISDWRHGRWTAKQAVRSYLESRNLDTPARIEVMNRDDGSPFVLGDGQQLPLTISLSHSGRYSLCVVAAGEILLGCDLEEVAARSQAFVETYFTASERQAVELARDDSRDLRVNSIWSAKESCLKAIRRGLREDTRSVEITLSPCDSEAKGTLAANFARSGRRLEGLWARLGDHVMTVVSEPEPTHFTDLE